MAAKGNKGFDYAGFPKLLYIFIFSNIFYFFTIPSFKDNTIII